MTQDTGSKSTPKEAGTREDRLKSALKANLAKRKAQARVRAQSTPAKGGSDDQ